MKKFLFILTSIPLSLFAQVIKIDGDNHLVTEKSFPLFLNGGTEIEIEQSKFSFLSVVEYDINQSTGANDLGFSQVLKLTSNQSVPENTVWKIVSGMEESPDLNLGDEYLGGIVFELNGNGGGKIANLNTANSIIHQYNIHNQISYLDLEYGSGWYQPNYEELTNVFNSLQNNSDITFTNTDGYFWTSSQHNGNYTLLNPLLESNSISTATGNGYYFIAVKSF